jgi:multidrug efflux system outer membrane protein
MIKFFPLLLACATLTACTLIPDFEQPKIAAGAAFKEAPTEPVSDGSWKLADTKAADYFAKGEWWRIYGDAQLNALMQAALKHNPTLEVARERLVQARAQVDVADSNLYPDVTVGAGPTRQKYSKSSQEAQGFGGGEDPKPFTLYRANATFEYGLDLFGRARSNSRAAEATARSEEATFRAAQLNLQADVAENYFALRSLTQEEKLLKRTLKLREDTYNITRKRYEIGDVSDLDVASAEGERAATLALLHAVERQRAASEHALATLTGKAPALFRIALRPLKDAPPEVPAGLPSSLLERRPDIAAAQGAMAAANARIGVARAAFFPSITLTANGGFESQELGDLFNWSSRTWALGPIAGTALTAPLFTGGRNSANLAIAKSSFRQAVATYRAQVLTAFRETEDALSDLRTGRAETAAQEVALAASRRAFRIARAQYENGFISYPVLLDNERNLLAAERGLVQARGQHYVASITLIRALGGDWGQSSAMPEASALTPVTPEKADNSPSKAAKPAEGAGENGELPENMPFKRQGTP